MKKIEEEIYDYFDDMEVPQLSEAQLEDLRARVRANKHRAKKFDFKPLVICACCMLAMVGVFVPVIMHFVTGNTSPSYYSDETANKKILTQEITAQYISESYPQYNFLLEECNYKSSLGYYNPYTDKLIAISIIVQQIAIPRTNIVIMLVVDPSFVYNESTKYITNSEKIETDNYIFYKKCEETNYDEKLFAHIQYKTHGIYVQMDRINEPLLDKFL